MNVNTTPIMQVAEYLAQQFATRADEADKKGQLPEPDIAALKETGYFGISVPREYGGLGLSLRECLTLHLTLAQGSASTAMVAGMPLHIFGSQSEDRIWTEPMFERLCRVAVAGGLVNSLASEPDLGSPSRGGLPATTAIQDGDEWVINGQKTWSTGGRHITHMVVAVRIEDDPAQILITPDASDIEWVETWADALSLRASDSHDVFFRDTRVPLDNLVQRGFSKTSLPPNGWFPLVMSSIYLGAAIAARDAVIRFALERVPTSLGKPIATLPKIQRQIGEIDLALQAAKSFLLEVAGEWYGTPDRRLKVYPQIVAAKYQVTEAATFVTEQALRVAGGTSITKSLPLERHFRDVRAGSMQPPSGDTALEIIGRNAIEQLKR